MYLLNAPSPPQKKTLVIRDRVKMFNEASSQCDQSWQFFALLATF